MMFPASPLSPVSFLSPVPEQVVKSGLVLLCPKHNKHNSVFSLDHSLWGGGRILILVRFPTLTDSHMEIAAAFVQVLELLQAVEFWGSRGDLQSLKAGAFLPWDQAEPLP